jgi:hypothetical protein
MGNSRIIRNEIVRKTGGDFTQLKNSNGTPFDSSTKLPVTNSNDAPRERPILNLRGYKIPGFTLPRFSSRKNVNKKKTIDNESNEIVFTIQQNDSVDVNGDVVHGIDVADKEEFNKVANKEDFILSKNLQPNTNKQIINRILDNKDNIPLLDELVKPFEKKDLQNVFETQEVKIKVDDFNIHTTINNNPRYILTIHIENNTVGGKKSRRNIRKNKRTKKNRKTRH